MPKGRDTKVLHMRDLLGVALYFLTLKLLAMQLRTARGVSASTSSTPSSSSVELDMSSEVLPNISPRKQHLNNATTKSSQEFPCSIPPPYYFDCVGQDCKVQ